MRAEGEVGERIGVVAEILTAESPVTMSLEPEPYFDAIQAIQRACSAEGYNIGVATWS